VLVILGRHRFDLLTPVPRRPSRRRSPRWRRLVAAGLLCGRSSEGYQPQSASSSNPLLISLQVAYFRSLLAPEGLVGGRRRDRMCRGRQRISVRSRAEVLAVRSLPIPSGFQRHPAGIVSSTFHHSPMPLDVPLVHPARRRRRPAAAAAAAGTPPMLLLQLLCARIAAALASGIHRSCAALVVADARCRWPSALRFAVSRAVETSAERGINSGRTRYGSRSERPRVLAVVIRVPSTT
jgi:hypothetical protein